MIVETKVSNVDMEKWHSAFSIKVVLEGGVILVWSGFWVKLFLLLLDSTHQDFSLFEGRPLTLSFKKALDLRVYIYSVAGNWTSISHASLYLSGSFPGL